MYYEQKTFRNEVTVHIKSLFFLFDVIKVKDQLLFAPP